MKTQNKPLKPFLKWAGGKTWLAPKLAEMYEPFRNTHIWVEPFCGALGATLGVMPERSVLNDINPHLINLYRHIKLDLQSPSEWDISKEMFDHVKVTFNHSIEQDSSIHTGSWWRAKAFYYLNRTCFNGLCRFNRKGKFNVGYGKYESPILNHNFSIYQEALKNWTFCNSDYDTLLFGVDNGQTQQDFFIYADPPYDGGFTSYSGSFTWDDQVKLATTLTELNCPVVASNKATDRIIALYSDLGFKLEFIDARRRIACNGDRTDAKEILATKNIYEYTI